MSDRAGGRNRDSRGAFDLHAGSAEHPGKLWIAPKKDSSCRALLPTNLPFRLLQRCGGKILKNLIRGRLGEAGCPGSANHWLHSRPDVCGGHGSVGQYP